MRLVDVKEIFKHKFLADTSDSTDPLESQSSNISPPATSIAGVYQLPTKLNEMSKGVQIPGVKGILVDTTGAEIIAEDSPAVSRRVSGFELSGNVMELIDVDCYTNHRREIAEGFTCLGTGNQSAISLSM